MNNPVHTILDNVRGIDNVLELAHQYNKKVLVASTSEVYGKSLDFLDPECKRSLSEEDYRIEGSTQNHRWAYANTKALDEFLSLAYYKQYGLKCVIIRFFNTVGPRQSSQYGMVIPNFVNQALRGEDITVYGDGSQTRSFLHVFDAIQAITELMITEHAVGQVYNVGNPFEISIKQLAERIIEKTNSCSKVKLVSYQEAYGAGFEDMQRRTPNIEKLTKTIGFKIRYDLEAILDSIIEHQKVKLSME
jgi:UDP-glucose 4-epimerase